MEVTETNTDGLKREFKVVVPASDLDARLNDRLVALKDRVQIRGFRPGKVPVTHLRKVYGRAVMAETIDEVVRETNAKIVTDRGLKLAMDPKITMPESESEIEGIIAGKSDLAYTIALEVVPPITLADFKQIGLTRLAANVADTEVDEAVGKIAEQSRPFGSKPEGGKVETGDRVMVKFTGTMDGQPFEGGSGDDINVHVGSHTFIPGFEDQLIGMAAGETRTVNVTFPGNYLAPNLAGKDAVFEVTAKSIETPGTVTVDEAFATSLGMESLDKLRAAVRERLTREHASVSRQKLKRLLLDELDKLHNFNPPPSLVEQEFNNVWGTVTSDLASQNRTFADEGTGARGKGAERPALRWARVRGRGAGRRAGRGGGRLLETCHVGFQPTRAGHHERKERHEGDVGDDDDGDGECE